MNKKDTGNFAGQKRKKQRNAPEIVRKGRNRVRFGCWRGWERLETDKNLVRKPGVRTQMNTKTMQHMKKENRRKHWVFAGFVAGAEGLGLGYRLGRFAAERHWRSLTPRHALRRAQPCLVAKSYRTLTKKSGTAEAIPEPEGNCGLPSQPQEVHRGGSLHA